MHNIQELYNATDPVHLEFFGFYLLSMEEPATFQEAMQDAHWRHAKEEETDAIQNNQTWSLLDPLTGQVFALRARIETIRLLTTLAA